MPGPASFRRHRAWIVSIVAALMTVAIPVHPGILGPTRRYRSGSTPGSSESWRQPRYLMGAGLGVTNFPVGWRPSVGASVAMVKPWRPWVDLAFEVDAFDFRYDAARGHLPPDATEISVGGRGSFMCCALGARVHGPDFGWRWVGLGEVTLPTVDQPGVSYRDATGYHQRDGVDIFGLDPGFVFGGGVEYVPDATLGGALEERMVIAPGRTEPTQYLLATRLALMFRFGS